MNTEDRTNATARSISADPQCVRCWGRGIIRARGGDTLLCSCVQLTDIRDTSLAEDGANETREAAGIGPAASE